MKELLRVISNEERAESFLRTRGVLRRFTHCPFCNNKHVESIRRIESCLQYPYKISMLIRGRVYPMACEEGPLSGKVEIDEGYYRGERKAMMD